MADRTSAGIFGLVFKLLAKNPTEEHKAIALKLWKESQYCDFSDDQMDADAALKKLGLARKRVSKEYPEDGPVWHYGPPGKDRP